MIAIFTAVSSLKRTQLMNLEIFSCLLHEISIQLITRWLNRLSRHRLNKTFEHCVPEIFFSLFHWMCVTNDKWHKKKTYYQRPTDLLFTVELNDYKVKTEWRLMQCSLHLHDETKRAFNEGLQILIHYQKKGKVQKRAIKSVSVGLCYANVCFYFIITQAAQQHNPVLCFNS